MNSRSVSLAALATWPTASFTLPIDLVADTFIRKILIAGGVAEGFLCLAHQVAAGALDALFAAPKVGLV